MTNYVIQGIGSYAPETVLTNDELIAKYGLDSNDEWIVSHTGIKSRHQAAPGQTSSDLAVRAAQNLLSRYPSISKEDIDVVIVATVTGDYSGFPSTACLVQNAMGLKAAAFDIGAACSGFVYGLSLAKGLLMSNPSYKKILVIGSEVLSSVTNWQDRGTAPLFGDGAGAAVIGREEGESPRGIQQFILGADGSGGPSLCVNYGGSMHPASTPATEGISPFIQMDGRAVYNFAVDIMNDLIARLRNENGLQNDDVAWIVAHQANIRILQAAAKRNGISFDKVFVNLDSYGNTSAASIGLALSEMDEKGLLKRGDKLLSAGFGGGLTYAGAYIIW